MNKGRDILKKYWGYDHYRPLQEEIIDDVIYGHDTFAVLPTGAGKSICFQVPGIAREGLTLVISPLISLMQDQVKNLISKGIRAKEITSGMTYRDIDIILDNAKFGAVDFLYTSPERLKSKLFIERFKLMSIGLIVVDEAHCISEWGHDFRPAYKDIKELRTYHPEAPIIALTATATPSVKKDIIKQLDLKKVRIHEGDFFRPNLIYQLEKVENKIARILNFCEKHKQESGIIYCQTRKSVKDVAKLLHVSHFNVGIYHGGMNMQDRKIMLDGWLNNRIQIMIATNAFGMGIDKPDVRFVLHYEMPNNLEAYFQESGRAGRDGNDSICKTFWEEKDLLLLKENITRQFPEIETVKMTYRALCNYLKIAIGSGKDKSYHLNIQELAHKFQLNLNTTFYSLKMLELNNDLVFSESVFHPTRVKIAIGNTELYSFQIKNEHLSSIISILTRSFNGIFNEFFNIDELAISKKLSTSKEIILKQLKELEKLGVIDINWSSILPTVTLTHERYPDDYLQLSSEMYHDRKNNAIYRLNKVNEYITNASVCRNKLLVEYFGFQIKECGKCDVCKQPEIVYQKEIEEIILASLNVPLNLFQILDQIDAKESHIKKAIEALLLSEQIFFENKNYYLNKKDRSNF